MRARAQATEEELYSLFAPIGEILELYILRNSNGKSRGCAFVTYANKFLAQQAITQLNGKQARGPAARRPRSAAAAALRSLRGGAPRAVRPACGCPRMSVPRLALAAHVSFRHEATVARGDGRKPNGLTPSLRRYRRARRWSSSLRTARLRARQPRRLRPATRAAPPMARSTCERAGAGARAPAAPPDGAALPAGRGRCVGARRATRQAAAQRFGRPAALERARRPASPVGVLERLGLSGFKTLAGLRRLGHFWQVAQARAAPVS